MPRVRPGKKDQDPHRQGSPRRGNGHPTQAFGRGRKGSGAAVPGDLYVVIEVRPHPIFTRQGNDIVVVVPITFPEAALGAEIEVPTIEGLVKLKIKAGTQSGETHVLRGKGVPHISGHGRGDQHVVMRVETPTKLSRRQRDILEEFSKREPGRNTPRDTGIFREGQGDIPVDTMRPAPER